MARIHSNRPRVAQPTLQNFPAVKAEAKKTLKAAFESLQKSGELEFHAGGMPIGQRFVRVPLKTGKGADQYSFTALVPAGALAPGAKPLDPNKTKSFFIERSGGIAGTTMVAGPVTMGAKGKVAVEPFFSRFLEGQQKNDGMMQTMKAPSDAEDGGGGGIGALTKKAPSDQEDGGAGKPGGGMMQTMKAPSDAEDGGGGGIGALTKKAPSDQEDGGAGKPGGGMMQTMKAPSDNEDGGGVRIDGSRIATQKFPSDNEDGGVR